MFGNKAKDKDFANMFLASFQENVKKLEKSGEYAAMLESFTNDDIVKAVESLKDISEKTAHKNEGVEIALSVLETILGSRNAALSADEMNESISSVLNSDDTAPVEDTESEEENDDFE